jgi:protein disulfide-isomerase/protein disulfide-isomerase A1
MLSKLAFVLAGFAYAGTELDGEVLVGSGDNIQTYIDENPEGVLIEFYAPWCGHCKKLEPEYEKAAKTLFDEGNKTPLVKVDATEAANSDASQKYGVQGYPTIKWFVGGSPADYDGPRDAAGIVDWIKSMTGPAVTEGEAKGDEKLSVTWHGDDASTFEEVAKANRKKASWFHVKGGAGKMVVKHKGEDAVESTPADKEAMEKAFKDSAFPLWGELNGETFGTYMEKGGGLVWALLKMDSDKVTEAVDENRETWHGIAKALGSDYAVTWTNTNEFGKVLESMFGVTEFPKVVVQAKAGAKKNYIYEGEMTKDAIVAYVEKVKAGEVEPHLRSEEVPEEPQEGPVKVVVGKNLEKLLFTEDKDVLLEVYAPWCGHCKKLEPEYIKVGKKVIKEGFEDILTIAKMDGTANDSPVESIEWTGFPTMYYVKMGNKEPVKYDGGRDAKGIWKWIKKNHSKADEIKAKIEAKKAEKDEKKEEL